MIAEAITVTTVGLGSDVDEQLLTMIADVGGGRYHKVPDPQQPPAHLHHGDGDDRRAAAVEEWFPAAGRAPADFLRGIDVAHRAVPPRLRRDEDEAAARAGDCSRATARSRSSRAGTWASAGRSRGRAT